MAILDTLAKLAAYGVFGYFAYTVLLPKLSEFDWSKILPQLPAAPPQQPFQQQAPPLAPEPPPPQQQQQPSEDEEEPVAPPQRTVPTQRPPPTSSTIAPTAPVGSLIWDSNRNGGWNNGQKRTIVGKSGDIETAASGNPRLVIDGNGVAHLVVDGSGRHGRIYVHAKNYNARLEMEFMFENTGVKNLSLKLRSRHQEGGACQNRFGGFGAALDRTDNTIGTETEACHNEHSDSKNTTVPGFQIGKWYKVAFSVWGNGPVNNKVELDTGSGLKTVHTASVPSPAQGVNQGSFNQNSYFWIRNNTTTTTGSIALRNVRLTSIGSASAGVGIATTENMIMFQQPYMYHRYYNRRRL